MKKKIMSLVLCMCMIMSMGITSMATKKSFTLDGGTGFYERSKHSDGGGITAKTNYPQLNKWQATRVTWAKLKFKTVNGKIKTESDSTTVKTTPYKGGNLTATVTLYMDSGKCTMQSAESDHTVTVNKETFHSSLSF